MKISSIKKVTFNKPVVKSIVRYNKKKGYFFVIYKTKVIKVSDASMLFSNPIYNGNLYSMPANDKHDVWTYRRISVQRMAKLKPDVLKVWSKLKPKLHIEYRIRKNEAVLTKILKR